MTALVFALVRWFRVSGVNGGGYGGWLFDLASEWGPVIRYM